MGTAATVTGLLLTLLLCGGRAVAADCTSEAGLQSSDLVAFTKAYKEIDACKSAAGKAAYQRELTLLKAMQQRNQLLSSICPEDDGKWEYVRNTLRIQTHFFGLVSKGCAE